MINWVRFFMIVFTAELAENAEKIEIVFRIYLDFEFFYSAVPAVKQKLGLFFN